MDGGTFQSARGHHGRQLKSREIFALIFSRTSSQTTRFTTPLTLALRVASVDSILRLDRAAVKAPPLVNTAVAQGLVSSVAEPGDGRLILMIDVEKVVVEAADGAALPTLRERPRAALARMLARAP